MIHLKEFQSLFENVAYRDGGFYVFENILKKFKERYRQCIEIAQRHDFILVKEMLDKNYTWKIILVFDGPLHPTDSQANFFNDQDYTFDNFKKLKDEIENLKPLVISEIDKRFLTNCQVDKIDKPLDIIKKEIEEKDFKGTSTEHVTIHIWFS